MRRTLKNRNPWVWFVACGWLGTCSVPAEAMDQPEVVRSIQIAVEKQDWSAAEKLTQQLIQADPTAASSYLLRARLLRQQDKFAAALPDYDRAVELQATAELYNERGCVRFQAGKIAESLADFDQAIKLKPELEISHWQRGISYYYLGQWEAGRKQFEAYQGYHDNDVENVVWRAMCMARDPQLGWDKAATDLWKVKFDRRVPLMTVLQLFADQATPDDVIKAVDANQPNERELLSRRFYAHLYLGLYYDCKQQPEQALTNFELAAGKYRLPGYMADVASVHVALLKQRSKK